MKVVVIDSGNLPAGVEFPPLHLPKYGWEQYPELRGADIAERCWRADIVVSLDSEIDRGLLEKMPKLRLIVAAGDACNKIDQNGAQEQGVELLAFPEGRCDDAAAAQDLCNRISLAIDHFVQLNLDAGESF